MFQRVFDFDGTIIFENSSRILEREVYEIFSGNLKYILYILFFSNLRGFITKLLSLLSLIFFDRRDLRLFLFLFLTRDVYEKNKIFLFEKTFEKIKFRKQLLSKISHSDIILSNGIYELILYILTKKNKKVTIVASNFDYKCINSLSNFTRKCDFLKSLKGFIYISDDLNEVTFLEKKLGGCLEKFGELFSLKV